jgi:signal transduction histidine kinase
MLRFGLRAQIVVALSSVFLLSFALLGTAAVQLSRAAGEAERTRAADLGAQVLAAAFEQRPDDPRALAPVVDALARRIALRAVRVAGPVGLVYAHGEPPPSEQAVTVPLAGGRTLSLWLERRPPRTHLPLGNLLLFYVSMTGLAVLMLAYIALTHLIVRPLDRLTRSSELLAAGSLDVRVPEQGSAEVVRLAAAFNEMAAQLRAERDALEQRLHELERTAHELATAQQQVIHGEKLASVGRLAAGVAHEIGNPLSAILGLVELLRGEAAPSPAQSAEFLERIQRETERIHRIIRDLLDFSRRDPEGEMRGQTAEVAEVVADAVNLVRPQKDSRDVRIEVDVEAGLGRVLAPQHRLTQVLLNLLLNAVDALQGRGTVTIEARAEPDGGCLLAVSDDGPGLPAAVLERLFEPFTTTKPPGKGTGLGLAVCHTLVEGMGGRIAAGNRPEGGARFEVHLRAAPTRASVPPAGSR